MNTPEKVSPIQAGGGAPDGTQRNMLALQDVEYLISAEVRLTELGQKGKHPITVYLDEIRRRARSGKCFHRPAFGVREFAADFEYEEDVETALDRRQRELTLDYRSYNEEIGLMLYDVFSTADRTTGFQWLSDTAALAGSRPAKGRSRQSISRFDGIQAKPQAIFFHAAVKEAKLDCHPGRVRFAGHNHH
jgi:CRISPR-associated protein Cas5d